MRSDMFKVIVERPRGRSWKDNTVRNRRRKFDFDSPSHARMREGVSGPYLNENLNPLRRYLLAQVNRPWNKVWSEIAANIDRRSTVQEHIYSHIDDFIAIKVEWRNGALTDLRRRYTHRDGFHLSQPLYVDPRTGIIRRNEEYRHGRRLHRAKLSAERDDNASRRRHLGDGRWHLKIDGEWYEVELRPLPPYEVVEVDAHGRIGRRRQSPTVFDIILKQRVGRDIDAGRAQREALYGSDNFYAVSRRQLSKREIAEYALPR
jgi:hypothetical protein